MYDDNVMNNPSVSVIVPVHNVSNYIERCARSLFEQTLQNMEYIFVNDCSPDNSMEILNNILQEYPHRKSQVKIINHLNNTGQSGARRDGMVIAKGDYIIHCDADDWVDVDMYETMYNKAVETSADSVCCDIVLEYADYIQTLRYCNKYCDHQLMYDCVAPISVEYCSMCNRLVSSKIYKEHSIVPFEGVNMWDDVGLSIRVRYYCNNNIVINDSFYHYNRLNEVSTTRRPLPDRIKEQIECAKQIELFFKNEGVYTKFKRFVSLIKLVAKDDLLNYDISLYPKVFPESRAYLGVLRCQYSRRQLVKRWLISYSVRTYKVLMWFLKK